MEKNSILTPKKSRYFYKIKNLIVLWQKKLFLKTIRNYGGGVLKISWLFAPNAIYRQLER